MIKVIKSWTVDTLKIITSSSMKSMGFTQWSGSYRQISRSLPNNPTVDYNLFKVFRKAGLKKVSQSVWIYVYLALTSKIRYSENFSICVGFKVNLQEYIYRVDQHEFFCCWQVFLVLRSLWTCSVKSRFFCGIEYMQTMGYSNKILIIKSGFKSGVNNNINLVTQDPFQ